MRILALLVAFLALHMQARAEMLCGPLESPVFHCRVGPPLRHVGVCQVPGQKYHYRYGQSFQDLELELVRDWTELTYEPWNGVGDTFWATLTFINKGYSYTVGYTQRKHPEAPVEGFLEVRSGDERVAMKACAEGSVIHRLDDYE